MSLTQSLRTLQLLPLGGGMEEGLDGRREKRKGKGKREKEEGKGKGFQITSLHITSTHFSIYINIYPKS
jgi:hypothetical protein